MSSISQMKYAREARDSMVKENVLGNLGDKKFLYLIELLTYCDATGVNSLRELKDILDKQYKKRVLRLP